MNINNKVFAITGAGSGLGLATLQHIVDLGGKVIAMDISEEHLSNLNYTEEEVCKVNCDVSLPNEVNHGIQTGITQFGVIHGGVHCAGIAPAQKIFSTSKGSHSSELFHKVISVNLMGSFHLINSITPFLIENKFNEEDGENGCIILTSSVASFEGQIGQIAYSASKGGVNGMILPAARELARYGIRINAIAPGIFETPMVLGFPEKVQQSLAEQIPFPKRLGKPSEYAKLAVSILNNKMINGTVIRLDGAVRMN